MIFSTGPIVTSTNWEKKITVQNIAVGVSLKATLARPKSQILSLQSAFAKIFLGFRSRWKTFATRQKLREKIINGFMITRIHNSVMM